MSLHLEFRFPNAQKDDQQKCHNQRKSLEAEFPQFDNETDFILLCATKSQFLTFERLFWHTTAGGHHHRRSYWQRVRQNSLAEERIEHNTSAGGEWAGEGSVESSRVVGWYWGQPNYGYRKEETKRIMSNESGLVIAAGVPPKLQDGVCTSSRLLILEICSPL